MKSLKPKVVIVGAGNVGSTFAFSLMISGLAREIVLIDKNEALANGESMDLNHGISFAHPTKIYAAGFESCKDADIVVITAGANQKPGQKRTDLIKANVAIFKDLIPEITKHTSNAILLVVTNPVDILTYVTLKISGFPSNRVMGSGTVLDTARLKYMIGEYYKIDANNIFYGISDVCISIPALVNSKGVEQYMYLSLSDKEQELFKHSASTLKKLIKTIDLKV